MHLFRKEGLKEGLKGDLKENLRRAAGPALAAALACGLIWFAAAHPAARSSIDSARTLPPGLTCALILAAAVLCAVVYMLARRRAAVERLFLCAGGVCLALMCAALPLGTAPDETAHISAAWRLASGQAWTGETTAPANLLHGVGIPATLRAQAESGLFTDRLLPAAPVPANEATGIYPALSYLPQAAGMRLALLLSDRRAVCLYAGRIANMLVFLLLGWLALRRIPFGKEALFAVLMHPLTLQEAASFSVDGVTVAGTALLLAVVLQYACSRAPMRGGDRAFLLLLCCCTVLWKVMYVPCVLLLLLIPAGQWGSRGRKAAWVAASWAAVGLCLLAWALHSVAGQTGREGLTSGAVSRLGDLLLGPGAFLTALWQTLRANLAAYAMALFDHYGALDIHLPTALQLASALLFLPPLLGEAHIPREPRRPARKTRALLAAAVLLSCGVIFASLYLWWTQPGAAVIEGIQARYFLPLIPLAVLALPALPLRREELRAFCLSLPVLNALMVTAAVATVTLG